jgi:hypothetical protein
MGETSKKQEGLSGELEGPIPEPHVAWRSKKGSGQRSSL